MILANYPSIPTTTEHFVLSKKFKKICLNAEVLATRKYK